MTFSNPVALVLLLIIPYFLWLGWPRLAYRRRRDVTSLIVRLLIVILVILALAGVQTVQAADKLAVVFLIDGSDSIDQAAQQQAQQYVRDAMSHMQPEDRAGIVIFGKNALMDRPMVSSKDPGGFSSAPIRLDTNIEGAIRLALAMFPTDAAKRIVILSDGVETAGNALQAAQLAAATNVQIDTVPLKHQNGPEALVSDVRVPTTVNQGEIFDIGVTVESSTSTSADLTILSAGDVVKTTRVDLKPGTNNFVISLSAAKQGFTDFQARIEPPTSSDTFYQNNELAGFTEVTGPPRVLVVTSKPEEIAALLPALQQTGIQVDVQAPSDLPIGIAPLAVYKSVVLANVSATLLTEQQMRVIQTYVRDLGGGLVVIGGPESYGMGGYFQTPLEETLPVDMRIKDRKRVPKLLMVYVIDRSGSMEEVGPSGVTNLELAKEAVHRSIAFLNPDDKAGVLSFDSNPEWLIPIQSVGDGSSMTQMIGELRPGGGTDIYAAVNEIASTVPQDDSTIKHVILLTDGGADSTGIVDKVRGMHDNAGITVTSIGIGSDVPPFMKDIATAGHGIYYNLVDLQTIPQIFAAETVLATRSYIVEKDFTPSITANSQIMRGIDGIPNLLGYVATTAKDTATVVMRAPGFDDPVLAEWQYGLGRAVAWTSDATSRWSKNWVVWDGFVSFCSQVIRSTIVEGANNKLEAHVEQQGDHSVLVVDAVDQQGGLINSLNLDASIIDPKLQANDIKLQQVAPGKYQASFDPQTEGAYFIRVGGTGGTSDAPITVAQTTGWVLSYSPEYRLRDTNTSLLEDIANLTGGTVIAGKPDAAFNHDLREEHATTALWPWLLLAAVVLLPTDIAVRRLIITRSDLKKIQIWVEKRLGILEHTGVIPVTSERMAQLMGAKERAGTTMATTAGDQQPQEAAQPTSAITPPTRPSTMPTPVGQSSAQPTVQPTVQSAPTPSSRPSKSAMSPASGDGSLASRLLEQRRKKEEDQ